MTNYQIVKKLIVPINPYGDSQIDEDRLENLKAMCELLLEIHSDVKYIISQHKDDHRHSVKEIVKYAQQTLKEL